MPSRNMTASTRPQAMLQPRAPISMLRTSARSALATLRDPVKVRAMIRPKMTPETRSTGDRTGTAGTGKAAGSAVIMGGVVSSVPLIDVFVGVVRFPIAVRLLPLGELHLFPRGSLVRNVLEQVGDDIEPRALLVIGLGHVPGRVGSIAGREHLVPGPGVIVPVAIGVEIHARKHTKLTPILHPPLHP